jgi:hypothetical protein
MDVVSNNMPPFKVMFRNGLIWMFAIVMYYIVTLLLYSGFVFPMKLIFENVGISLELLIVAVIGYSIVSVSSFLDLWNKALDKKPVKRDWVEIKRILNKLKPFYIMSFVHLYIMVLVTCWIGIEVSMKFGMGIGLVAILLFYLADNSLMRYRWYLSVSGLSVYIMLKAYMGYSKKKIEMSREIVEKNIANPFVAGLIGVA